MSQIHKSFRKFWAPGDRPNDGPIDGLAKGQVNAFWPSPVVYAHHYDRSLGPNAQPSDSNLTKCAVEEAKIATRLWKY